MRTARCVACDGSVSLSGDACVVEVDERSIDAMRALLGHEPEMPPCPSCGKPTGCKPTIVLWTHRRAGAEIVEGGPWSDGKQAIEVWPALANVELGRHDSFAGLRSMIVERCTGWF